MWLELMAQLCVYCDLWGEEGSTAVTIQDFLFLLFYSFLQLEDN